MTKNFSCPRGAADILPEEIGRWSKIEKAARDVLECYAYREIRTPIFEETELFARSMGQTSDVVQKQMLNLAAQRLSPEVPLELNGLSLRPEGTAAIVRSYIQNSLDKKESLSKFFYIGPMFRGERPQKGRLRQFHQIGVEAIGPNSSLPYLDAEVIALAWELLKSFGIKDFQLKINTLGSAEDKENFSRSLREQLSAERNRLCPDCQQRFDRNIFRILDCKNEECKAIVAKLQIGHAHLSSESRDHFLQLKDALNSLGVKYQELPTLVRGLDYYTHTVFEITGSFLGSQDALGAGGRYNNLVGNLGGSSVDAVGFALGIERILLASRDEQSVAENFLMVYVIALDERSLRTAFPMIQLLREAGISCEMVYRVASLKSQMSSANKKGARHVIILGENELNKEVVTLKNMQEGNQEEVSIKERNFKELIKILTERCGNPC